MAAAFAKLSPEDQLGLINDARDNGYVGLTPFGHFLTLASQVTPDTNAQVLNTLAGRMSGIDDVRWAEVPHPLGSLVADELAQRARLAIDQFESIVLRRS